MRFDIFAFFKKYPWLAVILLFGLAFYSSSKAWNEATIEGYIGTPQSRLATVTDAYTTEGYRRFRKIEHCHVKAQDDHNTYDTTVDCDDQEKYGIGATIELVNTGSSWESRSIMQGHFHLDLLLVFAEIFGILYYFRLARQPKPLHA